MTETPGLGARRAALTLCQAVLWRSRPLDAVLGRALRALDAPSDRALARAIAGHVLRWLVDLDAAIDGATRKRLPADARARMVLRMALAQVWILNTPAHAALATALPLVEGGPRRLVHGVLSALLKRGESLPDVPTLPEPWRERWHANWGADAAAAAARALAAPPPVDLTLRQEEEEDPFGGDAIRLAPHARRIGSGGPVETWPGYEAGAWWVQDFAASLPARLLAARPGERALDLCAAPGGKTMQLAAAGADVTAVDASGARLERLRANLARTGLSARIVEADARSFAGGPFDAVLLDAPCSATGIFRRHPDVLHLADERRLAGTAALQTELLAHAAALVRPGGRLVYAVCSLEPEEGEAQLQAFLASHSDWRVAAPEPKELPADIAPRAAGYIRILPGALEDQGGADGFFMVRLARV